jgi:glycine reductase complex component B subunit alpha and beta
VSRAGAEPLVIAHLPVDRVREAGTTTWRDGTLEVGLADIAALAQSEPGISEARAHVVQPGDPVRLRNVLDAVVPTVKTDSPEVTFPGALGGRETVGGGRTTMLDGVHVISTMPTGSPDGEEDELPSAIVDMDGPAAEISPFSATPALVLALTRDPDVAFEVAEASARRAALRAARDLAAAAAHDATAGERTEVLDLGEVDASLPRICAIVQITSEGPGLDTFVYGRPASELSLPSFIRPGEILDGAVTSGAYESPAARNPTATYQRSGLLRRLYAEHGRSLCFAGVILTLGYLDDGGEKRRMAEAAAALAEELGAAGAVGTTYSLGNSHTDTMLTVQACERGGIRAVAIVAEEGGLTDHVPEADALVSVGNVMELLPAWEPARVIGNEPGTREGASRTPVLDVLGAATQLGDGRLRAVSA